MRRGREGWKICDREAGGILRSLKLGMRPGTKEQSAFAALELLEKASVPCRVASRLLSECWITVACCNAPVQSPALVLLGTSLKVTGPGGIWEGSCL